MSRKDNHYDNAFSESFWSSLKYEGVYHRKVTTRAEARTAIFDYIEATTTGPNCTRVLVISIRSLLNPN
jgi:transposase InsO family protein